jgi:hypothetical protein
MKNKIIYILIVFLFIFIIVLILQYIGLNISDKYETQLEGLRPTIEELKDAEALKIKIDYQKKVIPFLLLISLIAIPFLFSKRSK